MMEQNWQNDPVKSPEIQEIILSNRIGIKTLGNCSSQSIAIVL
jgi:hypothetical protein